MRESRQLEFKEMIENYRDLNKELVAFLNDIGGEVLIGVADNGNIVGLTEQEIEKYLEEIPQAIFDGISPFCRPDISVRIIDDAQVMSVRVYPGNTRPYFIKSKGVPEGVYVRIGSHSMPANEDIIKELQRTNFSRAFDEDIVSTASIDDFDPLVLKSHYGTLPSEEQLLADKAVAFDPISKKLVPTVAGIVFFHRKPRLVLSNVEVLFTKFSGTNMSSIVKTRDYSSPLVQMANEIIEDIKRESGTNAQFHGAQLSATEFAVPAIAIREALNNALIHRKYFLQDAIKIALFDDRLEIFSPGNFPGPISDLRAGVSYSRNPAIRQLARNIGLVEKRGFGFRSIFESCEKNGNPEPQIGDQNGDFVKVIFFFAQKHSPYNASQWPKDLEGFKELFDEKKPFSLTDAAQILSCSKNTAKSRINYFIENKMVELVGKGRAVHYRWI